MLDDLHLCSRFLRGENLKGYIKAGCSRLTEESSNSSSTYSTYRLLYLFVSKSVRLKFVINSPCISNYTFHFPQEPKLVGKVKKGVAIQKGKLRMLCGGRNIVLTLILFLSAGGRAIGSACFNGPDYMCVDWSLGSERMYLAQYKYMRETGENVFFGVGSYGPPSSQNMGKCFKFYVENQPTPFIAQVTNYGDDINGNQFDMVRAILRRLLCTLYSGRN